MTHDVTERVSGSPDRTELSPAAYESCMARGCRFQFVSGPDAGRIVEVEAVPFVAGKGESADLVLGDATVSREHFSVEPRGGAFVIKDLDSTNGTWIDGHRIQEAFLRPGTVVRAGSIELRFEPAFRVVEVTPSNDAAFAQLTGRSLRMRKLFALLARVAPTDATVVLLGETGTGKSAVAKSIHEMSARKKGPFVTVDCGAIAETLIESELFGHEKGAFTGAHAQRKGALERAQGGTLFIDELVDLRLDLQPRLLRALEEREIRRVGGDEPIDLDVRVIAASRFDLWKEVEAKRFREDLYFRLAVFALPIPALRDRLDDVPLLLESFARSIPGGDRMLARLSKASSQKLLEHTYPGNVRELRNIIERAILLDVDPASMLRASADLRDDVTAAKAPAVTTPAGTSPAATKTGAGTIALEVDDALPFKDAKEKLVEAFEAEYVRRLLVRAAGHPTTAARMAEMDRKHLYNLAKKHGLSVKGKVDDD